MGPSKIASSSKGRPPLAVVLQSAAGWWVQGEQDRTLEWGIIESSTLIDMPTESHRVLRVGQLDALVDYAVFNSISILSCP